MFKLYRLLFLFYNRKLLICIMINGFEEVYYVTLSFKQQLDDGGDWPISSCDRLIHYSIGIGIRG